MEETKDIATSNFDVKVKATVGTFTSNMAEVLQFVKEGIEEYKALDVSEESYSYAKKMRANLNKTADLFNDNWKRAVEAYNKPLEQASVMASQIKQILKEASQILGEKIHTIEDAQHEQKTKHAVEVFNTVARDYPNEVQAFAFDCMNSWIIKKSWGNKGTSDAEIRNDSLKALSDIKFALSIFEGKYRNQVLDFYMRSGDLSGAQQYGKQLEEADKKAQERAGESIKETVAEQISEQIKAPEVGNVDYDAVEAPARPSEVYVTAPNKYINGTDSYQQCVGRFMIRAKRYQIEWLIDTCAAFGIQITKIQKGE